MPAVTEPVELTELTDIYNFRVVHYTLVHALIPLLHDIFYHKWNERYNGPLFKEYGVSLDEKANLLCPLYSTDNSKPNNGRLIVGKIVKNKYSDTGWLLKFKCLKSVWQFGLEDNIRSYLRGMDEPGAATLSVPTATATITMEPSPPLHPDEVTVSVKYSCNKLLAKNLHDAVDALVKNRKSLESVLTDDASKSFETVCSYSLDIGKSGSSLMLDETKPPNVTIGTRGSCIDAVFHTHTRLEEKIEMK